MSWRVTDFTFQKAHRLKREYTLKAWLNEVIQQKFIPPPEALERVRAVTHKLIVLLQNPKNKFKVDRCAPGGSYGKRTDTCLKVDLDIVVFVSTKAKTKRQNGYDHLDPMQMREVVFDEWRSMLQVELGLEDEDFGGKNALSFQLDGIDIDLSLCSPALTEIAIQSVKQQPPHVNDLCRLTKLWQSGVPYSGWLDGRSFLFECLSIYTVREIPNDGRDIVEAFCSFLENVIKFRELTVAFPKVYEKYIGKVDVQGPGLFFNPLTHLRT
ncbi:hypothetical protein TCAL_14531 [Tigriopus californicus]|uniref:2'-5'-oligoadenylate synthetase 1 domain-containing protein n=1 Tax=Tigriopus californicus TaxID=6832 RepID=A0A553PT85_TIGCA|nr:hypothetical protein TCAL_14531 [Tigriopus californicus]